MNSITIGLGTFIIAIVFAAFAGGLAASFIGARFVIRPIKKALATPEGLEEMLKSMADRINERRARGEVVEPVRCPCKGLGSI